MLFYYPVGQKFARNRSISYSFRDIHTFSFSLKSKKAAKSCEIEIFPLGTGHSFTTIRVKNLLKITLSLTVCEIFVIFHIFTKSSNNVAITHLYIEQQL